MLATASHPPHLLHPFPIQPQAHTPPYASSSMIPPHLPVPPISRGDTPSPTARGFKGLFARRPFSPTGESARTKFRTKSSQGPPLPEKDGVARAMNGRRGESRAGSPDPSHRIRFAPSAHPAMQKGDDGRWQPPSLSKGSLSTSALALYAEDETRDVVHHEADTSGLKAKKQKHSLSLLFHSSKCGKPPSCEKRGESSIAYPQPTVSDTWQRIQPPPTQAIVHPVRSPASPRFPAPPSHEVSQTIIQRSRASTVSKQDDAHSRIPVVKLPETMAPSPLPLCREHYLLRLSTSFIIRTLTPVLRGSGFATERNVEMRRIAAERLAILARLEKAWGGDWARLAGGIDEEGSNESRVRAVHVGDRAKERERKAWVEAMRDGILLCL
jgi:hypothetical protein